MSKMKSIRARIENMKNNIMGQEGNIQQETAKPTEEKYPISNKVEKIIKEMPPFDRNENKDSLASIQNPYSKNGYPPVKALTGVFTWTHDTEFASDILTILPDKKERAGLLSEAIDYYKENYGKNTDFFNKFIVKDLKRLADKDVISVGSFNALCQKGGNINFSENKLREV